MIQVHGVVIVLGKRYEFPASKGYGLIEFDGTVALIKFDCINHSNPPQGPGHILATSGAQLELTDGRLTYNSLPVHMGSLQKP